MGDRRTYDYVVALRAVQTTDFMTADRAPLSYDLLGRVSNRIINDVRGINRVLYDDSSRPPATIEWEEVSRSIAVHRRDIFQSDGKSDGNGFALGSRQKLAVTSTHGSTAGSGRKVRHPRGLSGHQRFGARRR